MTPKYVFFKSFWSQNVNKRSTMIELIIQEALEEEFADFMKMIRIDRKKLKFCRFLTFSVNFHLRLKNFDIGKI